MKPFGRTLLLLLCLLLVFPAGVHALELMSNGVVTITEPVADDVFATGGTVDVNARVSSLTVAGGTVSVNAPVDGDVVAAGGRIVINAPVGGKVILVGGTIDVNAPIGTNAIITGGQVTMTETASVHRDALISGRTVSNAGRIGGTLTVSSQDFSNTGSAGRVDYTPREKGMALCGLFRLFLALWTVGMFILGLLLIYLVPQRFRTVEDSVRVSPVIRTVIGFVAIVVLLILLVLLSFTVVLLPLALTAALIFLAGLLLSELFVAAALGRWVARLMRWEEVKTWQAFTVGFIIVALLSLVPVAGILMLVITVSLGFGALIHAFWENRHAIAGTPAS